MWKRGARRLTSRRSTPWLLRRQHLGSLDKVTRIVRLGVSIATCGADFRDQPKVADGASELLQDVFGKDKNPCRLVYGVASLPLGTPVEFEILSDVASKVLALNDASFQIVTLAAPSLRVPRMALVFL